MSKQYTEEQIIAVLKEEATGIKPSEICRKHGIADSTYYKWKAKYSGLEASDLRKLKGLEDENRRLKHLVEDLTLDNQALKAVLEKKF